MQVAVFHPGTQHSWQTALALQQLGQLAWYATSIFHQPDRFPYALARYAPPPLARRMTAEFRRFSHPGLDPALVRTSGLAEWGERLAARGGLPALAQRLDRWGNRRFVNQLADAIRGPETFALWGYSGSARSSFKLGKQHGRTCVLDRTNGDFRAYNTLMDEVAAQYGDWFLPIERRVSAADIANDDAEYWLADAILVGSPFAADTVRQAVPDPAVQARVRVLDYCFDEALFARLPPPAPVPQDRPVRFLFAGLAIPRKGIHLLLEAIQQLPPDAAELTIVGELRVPPQMFARYADRVTHRPTVARADMPAIMAAHDVLVLPSYFEGAGIVLYEALAAGCALIQSDRCAPAVSPDTGLLLSRLDGAAVLEAMQTCIDQRDRLNHWRSQAQARAQHFSFARYRTGIAAVLAGLERQG